MKRGEKSLYFSSKYLQFGVCYLSADRKTRDGVQKSCLPAVNTSIRVKLIFRVCSSVLHMK